jgi:predicted P-loop ATPase
MVASWIDDDEVNQAVLVFIGDQGIYKTTWFSHLLPPELRDYFRIKVNSSRVGKDDLITLSQYGLVCYEELDVMTPSNVNTMKSVVTMPAIDERPPYGHYTEHMAHVASFCGTGNNVQFLTDVTGNRRWLPFIVESITSPREVPFDYKGIYAQAYALYRQGFRHYFSRAEEEVLKEHNKTFETPQPEQEAIAKHFRQPGDSEHGEFYTATDILTAIGYHPSLRLTVEKIGSAMKALGYVQYRSHGRRGYRVVAYKPDEIDMNRRMLACDARPEGEDHGEEGDRGDT